MPITRREFVLGLAATVSSPILRGPLLPRQETLTLDVGFHGLWIFFVSSNAILAATPWNAEHCFRAGEHPSPADPLPPRQIQIKELIAGNAKFPTSNQLTEVYRQGIDAHLWWSSVLIPTPVDIQARRAAQLRFKEDAAPRKGYLSYHLRYNVDPKNLPLISDLPQWRPTWQSGAARLHFHAEPDHLVGGPRHAFAALDDVLAKLGSKYHVLEVSHPSTTALVADEDKSLSELGVRCSGTPGGLETISMETRPFFRRVNGDVANCMPLIITHAPVSLV